MAKCSQCAFENLPESKFCGGCGSKLSLACGSCGAAYPAGSRFCGQCGTPIDEASEAPQPAAEKPRSIEAERRHLTVLFSDLVGSTALSEEMDAEDLRDVVRKYQEVAGKIVDDYSGHTAQYLGDGILVYFGYPQAHEDDPRRAVRSGLEIVEALTELNTRLTQEHNVQLAVRIGIHTGDVVTGEVGTGSRSNTLALGSTPNIAARVQGEANPNEVLVTDATAALVKGYFQLEPVGRSPRGVSERITLYRALEDRSSRGVDADYIEAERTPFVGRERELGTLLGLLDALPRRRGQVAILTGEPGIGKSRLRQELRSETAHRDFQWSVCACSSFHQNTSLYPITRFLERAARFEDSDPPAERLEKLNDWLRGIDATDETHSLLASMLSLPGADSYLADLPPEQKRRAILEGFAELIVANGETAPLIFAVEDLHWADPSTLELIELLIARVAKSRVLLLLSCRPHFAPGWAAPPHQRLIQLSRLPETDCARLIADWPVARGLSRTVRELLVDRADGVPLFLEELSRSLAAGGFEEPDMLETGAAQRSQVARLIPRTLRDSLASRIDALGSAKEILQLGALLGRRFSYDHLSAVSDLREADLSARLSKAVKSGLIQSRGQPPSASYTFKHALVQDSAYDSLLRKRRRELHAQAAQALDSRFPSQMEREPETLGRHFAGAGQAGLAINSYLNAGHRSSGRGEYPEAIAHYESALSQVAELDAGADAAKEERRVLRCLAIPLTASQGFTSQRLGEVFDRSLALTEGLGIARVPDLFNLWGLRCVRGEMSALELGKQISEETKEAGGSWERAVTAAVNATNASYQGRHEEAIEEMRRALEAYDPDDPRHGRATNPIFLAKIVGGWSLAMRGYPLQAQLTIADALEEAETHDDPWVVAQGLSHVILVGHDLQQTEEVEAAARRSLTLSETKGLHGYTEHLAELHLATQRAVNGDEASLHEARKAIAATNAIGSKVLVPRHLGVLADAFLTCGRYAEGLDIANEAIEICSWNLGRYSESNAWRIRGELLALEGDRDEADSSLRKAMAIAKKDGAKLFELRAATALARLLGGSGRTQEGIDLLRNVYAWFTEGFELRPLVAAQALLDPPQS